MPPLLLPNGYLSWSQIDLWQKNKNQYIERYFHRGRSLWTKELDFGRKIHKLIEDGMFKHRDLIIHDIAEYEIRVPIFNVPILAKIDSFNSVVNAFVDYKTGKTPWTQSKVQKHDQLVLYATAIKHQKGIIPPFCHLIWLETRDKEGYTPHREGLHNQEDKMELTGLIVPFTRYFDPREIIRMENLIAKVGYEISEAYTSWARQHYPDIIDLDI
jgi:hypothetical protein